MSRSRTAFLSGTITDNPLSAAATTINSAALASLPAIASPDIAVLVLDPAGTGGAPEVVYVTAHTGSATSATISRAQEGTSAREHAQTIPWVHGPTTYDLKGWRLEASNSAEQTTTSTSATDLLVISGLLIPVTQAFIVRGNARKSAGAAAYAALGITVNATALITAHIGTPTGGGHLWISSNANQAENGYFEFVVMPRSTNYLVAGGGSFSNYAFYGQHILNSVALPNATITSITIRAISGSASVTVAVKDVYVEVMDL